MPAARISRQRQGQENVGQKERKDFPVFANFFAKPVSNRFPK
jgi:hypothetical protein